ncbi:MAG: AAA family ATPase [Prevotellaceae bacterium]|jgi:ATP-dependent exoDNAse (exonuclease V) alpha subunit|nr:AAA family ATPase [Prevotellaceae bacterium]
MEDSTPFIFTSGQQRSLSQLNEFIHSDRAKIFILKGYAGTGKTTLVKEIIHLFKEQEISFLLMASTGRAAKIMSNITKCPTSTVHSAIYTYKDFNQDLEAIAKEREKHKIDNTGQLLLQFELTVVPESSKKRYYIIDEASMIGDKEDKMAAQALFGSGQLLKDLLRYDPNGKFIFVGDICQLPPINESFSPALMEHYYRNSYQITPISAELTEIVRQSDTNDIISASHKIRKLYANCPQVKWAKFPLRGCKNIKIFADQATMLNDYVNRIKKEGYNNTTLICRANKTCDSMTSLIRPALGITQANLMNGDLLLITQNNYISGLMNGDLVEVIAIGTKCRSANLTFLHVEVKELFTQKVYSQLLIAEILYNNQTNLTAEQQKELFMDYFYRMKAEGINYKSQEFRDGMLTDIYLNALRAVFGYALTCHKSQGGEWEHVYLDIPRSFPLNPTPGTYQWLYTAMTRAKTQLYITEGFWLA